MSPAASLVESQEARDLPPGSVVATTRRVWIKRCNDQNPGSPFHATWWIEATTYAVQATDQLIQGFLDADDAEILRVGTSTEGRS